MFFKPLLHLTLLFSVNAEFSITFKNRGIAKYKLLPKEDGNDPNLEGGQGFVRFAQVVSSPAGFKFKETVIVALKIGFPGKKKEMENEALAHEHILKHKSDGIDGIVKVEAGLGESDDLDNDTDLKLPKNVSKQSLYFILVMENLGKDLLSYHQQLIADKNFFEQSDLLAMHLRLNGILKAMDEIKICHGDVKLENILLNSENDPKAPITLIDLALAVFEGSQVMGCSGDRMYMSPAQMLTKRQPTYNDCVVSGVYSIVYLATSYLPWIELCDDNFCEKSEQKTSLHHERIALSKHCFNRRWLWYMGKKATSLPSDLKNALSTTLLDATSRDKDASIILAAVVEFTAVVVDDTLMWVNQN